MQAFHHLHWSNPGVSAGPFMCIVTQAHEFLQDRGLIAFYVVPYPVIYHLVTGLYVRSAFSYLSRLIETRCFMKATEHSLPLWSSLKLFHLLIFHPVLFQSFRVSEDIPLEEEYLRGTVCLLSVFWLKKKEGSPLLTFFCLPEHIRLSASSCTGHSLHSHSFKGWIEVGCFFSGHLSDPLWCGVNACAGTGLEEAGFLYCVRDGQPCECGLEQGKGRFKASCDTPCTVSKEKYVWRVKLYRLCGRKRQVFSIGYVEKRLVLLGKVWASV